MVGDGGDETDEEETVELVAVTEVEWLRVVRDTFTAEKGSTFCECLGGTDVKPDDSQSVSLRSGGRCAGRTDEATEGAVGAVGRVADSRMTTANDV